MVRRNVDRFLSFAARACQITGRPWPWFNKMPYGPFSNRAVSSSQCRFCFYVDFNSATTIQQSGEIHERRCLKITPQNTREPKRHQHVSWMCRGNICIANWRNNQQRLFNYGVIIYCSTLTAGYCIACIVFFFSPLKGSFSFTRQQSSLVSSWNAGLKCRSPLTLHALHIRLVNSV